MSYRVSAALLDIRTLHRCKLTTAALDSGIYSTVFNPDLFKLESTITDGLSGTVFQPHYTCPGQRCAWGDFTTLAVCGDYRNLTDVVTPSCKGSTSDRLNCTYRLSSDLGLPLLEPDMAPLVMSFAYQEGPSSAPNDIFQSVAFGAQGFGAMLYSVRGPVQVGGSLKTAQPTTSY